MTLCRVPPVVGCNPVPASPSKCTERPAPCRLAGAPLKPVIPTDLRRHILRNTAVQLSPALCFQVHEVLHQHRPNQWSRLWPSAVALSQWWLEQPAVLLPESALELGCGLGLVSMTMAHLGIRVQATDREVLALAFAQRNAQLNALTGVTVSHLDWSEPEGASTGYVVASDVLYEKGMPDRIFDVVHTQGLLRPLGTLLFSSPQVRPERAGELVVMLKSAGYQHRQEARCVTWEGQTELIDIHVLNRPG